jgi:hypothetical protein
MSTRVKSPGKARAKSPGKARAKSPRPPKVVPKPAPKPKAAPKPRAAPRPPRAKSPAATATGGRKPAGSNGAVGAGAGAGAGAASRVFAAPLVSLRPFTCGRDGCTDRFMNQAQLIQHEQQAHRGGKPRRVTLLFNVPAVIFPFYSDEPPAAVRSRAVSKSKYDDGAGVGSQSQPAGMGGRVMSSASHHRFTVLASQHATHYPAPSKLTPRPAMPPPPPPSAAMFRFGGVQGGGGGSGGSGGSASATHWWAAGR